jgi:hypothetical protein
MDRELLAKVLTWIVSGGGGSVVTYWLMEKVGFLAALTPKWKRRASFAIAAVLPLLAWGASIGMGYNPVPESIVAGIEEAAAIFGLAFGVSQIIHGERKL